jgi:hypothetical protein
VTAQSSSRIRPIKNNPRRQNRNCATIRTLWNPLSRDLTQGLTGRADMDEMVLRLSPAWICHSRIPRMVTSQGATAASASLQATCRGELSVLSARKATMSSAASRHHSPVAALPPITGRAAL